LFDSAGNSLKEYSHRDAEDAEFGAFLIQKLFPPRSQRFSGEISEFLIHDRDPARRSRNQRSTHHCTAETLSSQSRKCFLI